MLPADYASQLLPPQWRASFPYRSAFGSLCSLAPLACALIDHPFAFNARLELFLRPSALDGSTSLLLPFSASVPLFGRAEVGLGSCYAGVWNPNPDSNKVSDEPSVRHPSGLCPFWFAGKLLLFPWFRDPHAHPALSVEYLGEYQAGPFNGLNQLGLPGPLSKVSLAYRHPLGGFELSGAASMLVDHITHAGTMQFGVHVGYRLPVGEHFWIFGQALAQLPSFGPMIPGEDSGQTLNLAPPKAGTLVAGVQQRADFGFGVGLSLMLTKSELETRVDVLLRLLSFEIGPHIKALIPAKPTNEDPPKLAAKVVQPSTPPGRCLPGQALGPECIPDPPPKPVYDRLPGGPCYLYSEDGSEKLVLGHIDSTGHYCDWDRLHLPLGAVIPPGAPDAPPLPAGPVLQPATALRPVSPMLARRTVRNKPVSPLVESLASRPSSARAPATTPPAVAKSGDARLSPCAPPPVIWRRGLHPVALGFTDGAVESCEHAEQIYQAIKEHGALVVLPRPQDIADWWQETKKECFDRLGPCIREKAQNARAELDRFRRLSWEQKQYELGKVGYQIVEQTVINATLPGGGMATGGGVRAAEHAAEEQLAKAAKRKLEKEAAERAGEAAAKKAAKEAAETEAKRAAEAEAKRAAEAAAAGTAEAGERGTEGLQRAKAKDRRAQEHARAKEDKHGDPNFEEPASEDYAKWRAKRAEKAHGKDSRRDGHDRKEAGEGDRSKRQLMEDYE